MSEDKHKILVIDDDPDFVTFMKTLLEDNGYQVVTAKDGNEGLARLGSDRPDLILLDITMPEKTGVRFYREIKDGEQTRSIPVVMVTGVMKEFEKFIKSRKQVPPPDGYINKPVDQAKLLDTIARILSGNGPSRVDKP